MLLLARACLVHGLVIITHPSSATMKDSRGASLAVPSDEGLPQTYTGMMFGVRARPLLATSQRSRSYGPGTKGQRRPLMATRN